MNVSAQTETSTQLVRIAFGTYYWNQNYSGDFKISELDIRPVDVESDLAISEDNNSVFYVELSHDRPYIPQLRIQKTLINSTKSTVIQPSRFFSLGGAANLFSDLRAIQAEMDFDHLDIDVFFKVWKSEASISSNSLNVGVALRKFNGFTFVSTTDDDSSKCSFIVQDFSGCSVAYRLDFKNKVPLLYLSSNIELGIPELILNTSLHYGNYKKNKMTDIDLNMTYTLPCHLSLFVGYRHAVLDLGDFSGLVADITTSGIYGGLGFRF